MKVFQFLYTAGNVLRRIVGQHRASSLENRLPLIVVLIYIMYGYSSLRFTGCFHGFMHVHAVHTLAAVPGEQGRVDVDNPLWECSY